MCATLDKRRENEVSELEKLESAEASNEDDALVEAGRVRTTGWPWLLAVAITEIGLWRRTLIVQEKQHPRNLFSEEKKNEGLPEITSPWGKQLDSWVYVGNP